MSRAQGFVITLLAIATAHELHAIDTVGQILMFAVVLLDWAWPDATRSRA